MVPVTLAVLSPWRTAKKRAMQNKFSAALKLAQLFKFAAHTTAMAHEFAATEFRTPSRRNEPSIKNILFHDTTPHLVPGGLLDAMQIRRLLTSIALASIV